MRCYDICPILERNRDSAVDLVIVLQHDLLNNLTTRVVAPLLPADTAPSTDRINPRIVVQDAPYIIALQFLTTMPLRALGRPLMNASDDAEAIKRGIDLLFFGV